MRKLLGALIALAGFLSPALASQATLITPGPPLPMTSLASFLNAALLSIGSCNSGSSAPTNGPSSLAFAGQCWANTTANSWVFQYTADGTHWSPFGYLNSTTFQWSTAGVPPSTDFFSPSGSMPDSRPQAKPTVIGAAQMVLGSDANGDVYYNSNGTFTRLPVGTNTQVLTISGGLPIWAAGSSAASVTVGTTTISSGTTNQLLFDNGGVLGEVTKGNSCVYATNGSGVPSCVTTLPAGLSAASFTVTSAFTATGLVTNADLVNSTMTVNGTVCTLGASCTPAGSQSVVAIGSFASGEMAGGTMPDGRPKPGSPSTIGQAVMVLGSDSTGDIHYTNAYGQLTRLPIGSAGNPLVVSGGLPSWAPLALANLATQTANTVLVNATAGSAAPTAQSVSGCSAAADALIWTTNTGFGCNASITAASVPWSGVTSPPTTLSGYGITSPLPVNQGGTAAASASGTALDNITGFASTGFLTRTGAGAYSFQSTTNGITFANLAQGGANTVLSNWTGSTANLAANAYPSCADSGGNHLNYVNGTGITCGTSGSGGGVASVTGTTGEVNASPTTGAVVVSAPLVASFSQAMLGGI